MNTLIKVHNRRTIIIISFLDHQNDSTVMHTQLVSSFLLAASLHNHISSDACFNRSACFTVFCDLAFASEPKRMRGDNVSRFGYTGH